MSSFRLYARGSKVALTNPGGRREQHQIRADQGIEIEKPHVGAAKRVLPAGEIYHSRSMQTAVQNDMGKRWHGLESVWR